MLWAENEQNETVFVSQYASKNDTILFNCVTTMNITSYMIFREWFLVPLYNFQQLYGLINIKLLKIILLSYLNNYANPASAPHYVICVNIKIHEICTIYNNSISQYYHRQRHCKMRIFLFNSMRYKILAFLFNS